MGKGDYKKNANGKETYISGRLRDRQYICIANAWKKWAKRYLNKRFRKKIPSGEYNEK